MTTLWIGIDIAKASLVAVALWQEECMHLGEFKNDQTGFVGLAAAIQSEQARCGAAAIQWVVEPTGGYELPLVNFVHEQGWLISLPNPRQVRQWAKGTGQRAKTAPWGPPQDAMLLARFEAAQQPAPPSPTGC